MLAQSTENNTEALRNVDVSINFHGVPNFSASNDRDHVWFSVRYPVKRI